MASHFVIRQYKFSDRTCQHFAKKDKIKTGHVALVCYILYRMKIKGVQKGEKKSMKIQTPFTHLFTPLKVGNVLLRNRVVAAPITSYAEEPSPADKFESIAARARGGAGLIIIGSVAVNDEEALIYYESSSLFGHEKKIYEEMVSMIHQYGAKASVEPVSRRNVCGLPGDGGDAYRAMHHGAFLYGICRL